MLSSAIADLIKQGLPQGAQTKVSWKEDCLKIMLESIEVPDQIACIEFVRKILTDLNSPAIRQVKIYGRELDEDFPSWHEEFAIAPQESLPLEKLAGQGDLEAISLLLNQ